MPRKMIAKPVPISTITVCALRTSGGLNAGTPLETASVPVSATAPDENARRISSSPSGSATVFAFQPGGRHVVGHGAGQEAEQAEQQAGQRSDTR